MVPLPPGNARPSAGWIAVVVGGLWSLCIVSFFCGAARADDLNGVVDKIALHTKQCLDGERESSIALNQFTAPARLAANSSSGIRKALEEALRKLHVTIKRDARLEIKGEYREGEDRRDKKKSVVRVLCQIVDQERARPPIEWEEQVDDITSMSALVGATMEPLLTPVPELREQSIRKGLSAPSARVSSTRISAASGSPFGIEILTGPVAVSDHELRPRAAVVDGGQAYMNIRTDERYAVVLINNAPFDVAVTLTIDGLSIFSFSENKDYSYLIVPKHTRGLVTGWHRTNEQADRFVVTDYSQSAAASRSLTPSADLGVITACFAAAWQVGDNPPPDEGMEGRSSRGTGRGPITHTEFVEVERKTGRLRAAISLRYTKEKE
jgi:hypothetical protein